MPKFDPKTTNPPHAHQTPATWFIGFGIVAVVTGGALSAFLAHQPSQLAMWASAYLVLVVGVAQIAFGVCLYKLARPSKAINLWVAFVLYNVANAGVLFGTIHKTMTYSPALTFLGGIGLMLALACMTYSIRGATSSRLRATFYIVAVVIFVGIPIGLWLAQH